MEQITTYGLRKCSDTEMEYPYFEVVDQNGVAFMDVSKTDNGEIRVLFYPAISSKCISLAHLEAVISEAREMLA